MLTQYCLESCVIISCSPSTTYSFFILFYVQIKRLSFYIYILCTFILYFIFSYSLYFHIFCSCIFFVFSYSLYFPMILCIFIFVFVFFILFVIFIPCISYLLSCTVFESQRPGTVESSDRELSRNTEEQSKSEKSEKICRGISAVTILICRK